ncbi:MAG: ABC transporter ATP-binding protein [Ignavibacteria bacterium]|nr:ABC transporter ATP-binding protein [Ignavibacteria bacterium]
MKAVEFKNISKSFGNCIANEDISFGIEKNSVHCILGENGAGKSTLMKMLFGIYKPDNGVIRVFDKEVSFTSPHDAIDVKIGMVHQHFMLIDDFTVLENVILGNELTKGIKIDFRETKKLLNELIDKYNLGLNTDKKISEISISEQQKVEILKLLFRDSEILIFDEPTAVLSPIEVKEFFKIIDEFKSNGKTIILITHKLNEVKEISDKVSVLRRGKLVYEQVNDRKLDIETLSRTIVGEAALITLIKSEEKEHLKDNDEEVLSLKNIHYVRNKVKVLDELNLQLRKGEIHGICGVEGNGQNEIVDIITGLQKDYTGEVLKKVKKISLVPDDRIKKGMIKEFTIGENIFLKDEEKNIITKSALQKISQKIKDDYDVRLGDINSSLSSLSGGNQQKVIVAREIELDNAVLIFSHPTRGVDINATLFIHSKIIDERNKGKSILLISSDLDELVSLSDRLSVLDNGKIVKTFEPGELNVPDKSEISLEMDIETSKPLYEQIGKLMIGITQ